MVSPLRCNQARGIAAASAAELAEVEGISADLAERIKEHFGSGLARNE